MTTAFKILASSALCMVVLGAMFVVVLMGTYYQVDHGIHAAQLRFFDSWCFDLIEAEGVYVPFPGGLLLMSLLSVNLIAGGIFNLQRTWSRLGILISHLGIAVLMIAGLVKFTSSIEGGIQLYEGESAAAFVAYHELEIAIVKNMVEGGRQEWLIGEQAFRHLDAEGAGRTTVALDALPFRMRLERFFANARIEKEGLRPASDVVTPIVGGFYVMPRLTDTVDGRNASACYFTVTLADGTEERGILSELARWPFAFEVDGVRYGAELRRRQFDLPFAVELVDFEHKVHPTSGRPLSFTSDVVARDPVSKNELQKFRIAMNKPLRRDGFAFYQSSWGPEDAGPGDRLYSVFSVVKNPSDQWPLIALIITMVGMLIHFGWKLGHYILSLASGPARAGDAKGGVA